METNDKSQDLNNKISKGEIEPPTKEFLDQLQAQALEETKEQDATVGEQIIREGLQPWPDLIDEELKKFKEKIGL